VRRDENHVVAGASDFETASENKYPTQAWDAHAGGTFEMFCLVISLYTSAIQISKLKMVDALVDSVRTMHVCP
jgi:hypothetical protein